MGFYTPTMYNTIQGSTGATQVAQKPSQFARTSDRWRDSNFDTRYLKTHTSSDLNWLFVEQDPASKHQLLQRKIKKQMVDASVENLENNVEATQEKLREKASQGIKAEAHQSKMKDSV